MWLPLTSFNHPLTSIHPSRLPPSPSFKALKFTDVRIHICQIFGFVGSRCSCVCVCVCVCVFVCGRRRFSSQKKAGGQGKNQFPEETVPKAKFKHLN